MAVQEPAYVLHKHLQCHCSATYTTIIKPNFLKIALIQAHLAVTIFTQHSYPRTLFVLSPPTHNCDLHIQ